MSNDVAKTSASYDAMASAWALPRALMGGTRAMREAGKTYLPQEPAESDAAFDNRLRRSVLFNAFRRTVRGIMGKVFSKKVAAGDDVPIQIGEWLQNVDLAGQNLNSFAANVFTDGLQVGLSHIFIDMPAGPAARTQREEAETGRRPYFVHIRAEDLIGWKSRIVNGKEELSQIRFRERVAVEDGAYGEKFSERVRVVWPNRFEVWEKQKSKPNDEQWALIAEGELSLGKVPLVTFYANRTGFMTATPPLEDLAHLNVAHWQSASDQRHILHVARVPLLFGRNLKVTDEDGKKIEYGPNRMIVSDDPQGDLKFVEHGGAAINAGRQDLIDIEDRMRVMGLELFMPKTGNQTATGKAIDSAEQNSTVKMMALALQNTVINALGLMADWMKIPSGGGTVQVNTDFGVSIGDAQELTLLLNARLAGEISQLTFWSELKRRGLLIEGFDPTLEAEQLSDEAPALGAMQ